MLPPGVDDTEYKDKSKPDEEGQFLPYSYSRSISGMWVCYTRYQTYRSKVSKTFSKEFNFRMAREQQFSNCDQQTSVDYL